MKKTGLLTWNLVSTAAIFVPLAFGACTQAKSSAVKSENDTTGVESGTPKKMIEHTTKRGNETLKFEATPLDPQGLFRCEANYASSPFTPVDAARAPVSAFLLGAGSQERRLKSATLDSETGDEVLAEIKGARCAVTDGKLLECKWAALPGFGGLLRIPLEAAQPEIINRADDQILPTRWVIKDANDGKSFGGNEPNKYKCYQDGTFRLISRQ